MTEAEVRERQNYKEAIEQIKGYCPGFTFFLHWPGFDSYWRSIWQVATEDAVEAGYLRVIERNYSWDKTVNGVVFERTDKEC